MEVTPTIHVWHDYVCPFCNVEATRIARIKEEEGLDLAVRFHPWPLEVAYGRQPRTEDEDQWVQLLGRLEPDAFDAWDPSSGYWPTSSRLLFAAYEAALAQDIEAAEQLDLLIRRAIFRQPRPIYSLDALCGLATETGLDVAAFRVILEDGTAQSRVESAASGEMSQEIRGIPTLVLPDGSVARSPGLKIRRTAEGRSIDEDIGALRKLMRQAAGAARTGTNRG